MVMKFKRLLELVGDGPVFETSLLLAGDIDPNIVRLQLTRWTKTGRIYQLRRGLYAIAPPYQKRKPHPFLIANCLHRSSYVSLQSALAFYGLIPDTVNVTLSVTVGRPELLETPLGSFRFRHIKTDLLFGYKMIELNDSQQALVALPEKALLDLVYLQTGGETQAYLKGLRLQNLEVINLDVIKQHADVFNTPKLRRAIGVITQLKEIETQEYEVL